MTKGITLEHELQLRESYPDFCQGLIKFGLKQERRKIRLTISDTCIDSNKDQNCVTLSFNLPAGCFATTVLRELVDYRDLTQRDFTPNDPSQKVVS